MADSATLGQSRIHRRPVTPPIWAFFLYAILLVPPLGPAYSKSSLPAPEPLAPQRTNVAANVTPVCLDRSNIPADQLYWLYMPATASALATSEDYAFLAGQLIQAGVVNASDCPLGGLLPDGYATGCGLAKARPVSLYLQNVYDQAILAAGKDVGVPPVMIKQLIRYESQFWPVQWGPYHFGLGHLTSPGASSALLWNPNLNQAVLAESPTGGDLPNTLLSIMNAYCPTCQYGIDIPKAQKSVAFLAQVLLAYCRQATQIVFNATKISPGDVVDYPTIWRLALLNYNAGPMCAFEAVKSNFRYGSKLGWTGIADNMTLNLCIRGVAYVDLITAPYYKVPPTP